MDDATYAPQVRIHDQQRLVGSLSEPLTASEPERLSDELPPRGLRMTKVAGSGRKLMIISYPLCPKLSPDALTEAEAVVVLLAWSGFSNAQIAEVRKASVRTIANQLASAYRKLGGVSRASLNRVLAWQQEERSP